MMATSSRMALITCKNDERVRGQNKTWEARTTKREREEIDSPSLVDHFL